MLLSLEPRIMPYKSHHTSNSFTPLEISILDYYVSEVFSEVAIEFLLRTLVDPDTDEQTFRLSIPADAVAQDHHVFVEWTAFSEIGANKSEIKTLLKKQRTQALRLACPIQIFEDFGRKACSFFVRWKKFNFFCFDAFRFLTRILSPRLICRIRTLKTIIQEMELNLTGLLKLQQ